MKSFEEILTEKATPVATLKSKDWKFLISTGGMITKQELNYSKTTTLKEIKKSILRSSKVLNSLDLNMFMSIIEKLKISEINSFYHYTKHFYAFYNIDQLMLQQVAINNVFEDNTNI